jgi:5'(3')-deoxyribonucleotidase
MTIENRSADERNEAREELTAILEYLDIVDLDGLRLVRDDMKRLGNKTGHAILAKAITGVREARFRVAEWIALEKKL